MATIRRRDGLYRASPPIGITAGASPQSAPGRRRWRDLVTVNVTAHGAGGPHRRADLQGRSHAKSAVSRASRYDRRRDGRGATTTYPLRLGSAPPPLPTADRLAAAHQNRGRGELSGLSSATRRGEPSRSARCPSISSATSARPVADLVATINKWHHLALGSSLITARRLAARKRRRWSSASSLYAWLARHRASQDGIVLDTARVSYNTQISRRSWSRSSHRRRLRARDTTFPPPTLGSARSRSPAPTSHAHEPFPLHERRRPHLRKTARYRP